MDLAGSSLRVTAAPGETNAVAITSAGGLLTIVDGGSLSLTAGLGCSQAATARVTCSTSGVTSVLVDAGDGNDTVTLAGLTLPATLTDGLGDDTITGGSGNDTFIGSGGNDTLNGGPGNDTFGDAGGAGADSIAGGPGTDTADYSSRTTPLAVRLDDVPGDGAAGENDNVRSDVEAVNGGTAPDLLVGSPAADTLRGNGGEDVFDGRGGADTFAGGSGQDTVDYSSRAAAVTVTLDGTANDGETGELDNVGTDVDIVLGGAGNDAITGHSGANELRGNDGNDTLNAAGGDDVLRGGDGADRLDGGTGNDVLDGGAGADGLTGGANTDAVDYSSRSQAVSADLNGTTGFGEPGENDTVAADVEGVYGGAGDDQLTGNAGANVLRGNAGNDVLDGRLGADDVSGGDGTDSVSYAARTAAVTVRLDNGAGDGQAGENDNVHSDVEQLAGGSGDDKLYADDDANVIVGNGGNDTVYGYGGDDAITVAGGADSVDAGAGNDTVTAGAGNDSLTGGAGDDSLVAGDGNDKLSGGDGNDTLDAGAGDDSGDAGNGDDRIAAGDGNDSLSGGEGIDWLDGAGGNDKLWGNNGNDNIDGGIGDDSLDGGAGDDGLNGADGNDTVNGSDGNDALEGADGNDTLNGGRGTDTVSGSGGDDKVAGNEDADTLTGGAGDDQVWGGSGNDTVTDGDGANKLYGEDGDDSVTAGPGNDLVSGGNGADLVDGGAGDDVVNGDNDNDRLQGGDGADRLAGGAGDDVLDGGLGPDTFDGADGTDTADYGSRAGGVVVTNDGKADDGAKNEGDNVSSSIDDAIGSSGDDRLTFATDWPHKLDGGDGNDLLRGGPREDTLTGGRGKDALFGEGGTDVYDGGAGPDHLSAADGLAEKLLCGSGKDVGVLDKSDTAVGCEKRTVKAIATSAPVASAPAPVRPTTANGSTGQTTAGSVRAPSGLIGVRRVATRGRFVSMPGSPGVRVDRRIVKDLTWILKHYRVRINAGYALTGHALHGEHPIGLAVDLVPAAGGSWDDVDRLAKWAEPRQNYPRPPFRWVGYNGDPNHGRGNHLHLSWMHAATSPGHPAAWVVTMRFRSAGGRAGRTPAKAKGTSPARATAGALVGYARSNASLGRTPKLDSGLDAIARCQGVEPLKPTLQAASRAFGLDGWRILAGLTETESAFGCNMGPSSAGAIGWTQFMPGTWAAYGMDADGDGKADPYDSVDAVFSTARYLRASGAPGSWRRALFTYNHDQSYVDIVLARAKKY